MNYVARTAGGTGHVEIKYDQIPESLRDGAKVYARIHKIISSIKDMMEVKKSGFAAILPITSKIIGGSDRFLIFAEDLDKFQSLSGSLIALQNEMTSYCKGRGKKPVREITRDEKADIEFLGQLSEDAETLFEQIIKPKLRAEKASGPAIG